MTSCNNQRSHRTLFIYNGQPLISSTNFSNNTAFGTSAYVMGVSNNYIGKTNYSIIEGNKCKRSSETISLEGSKHLFEYCIVLKNYQESNKEGTLGCDLVKEYIISKSCFIGDLGNGKLFSSTNSDNQTNIIIKDCQIDKYTRTGEANFVVHNIEHESSFDFAPLFSTYLCEVNINLIYIKNNDKSHKSKGLFQKFACMFNLPCKQMLRFLNFSKIKIC